MQKKFFLTFTAVLLVLTSLLAVGCRGVTPATGEDITGYSTPAATVQPTALAGFGTQATPQNAVENYFKAFGDTIVTSDPRQRFGRMYTLMQPNPDDPCAQEKFIALQEDIRVSTGSYARAGLTSEPQVSGDTATVVYDIATVSANGTQTFTLVKDAATGGWVIQKIVDEVNPGNHNWPPEPEAGWVSAASCGGGSTGGSTGTDATAATATP